jgi:hypothetical protein
LKGRDSAISFKNKRSAADAAQPRHLKAGGRLFAIGDAGDGCYRLGQGLLKAQEQAEHEAYSWNSDRVDQSNSQDCPLALHVLAYNLTRAMKIMGIQPCPAPGNVGKRRATENSAKARSRSAIGARKMSKRRAAARRAVYMRDRFLCSYRTMQNEDSPVLVSVPDETPQSSGVELTVRGYRPPEMTRRS